MDNTLFTKLYNLYCDNLLSHVFLIESNNIDNVNNDILRFIKKVENFDENKSIVSLYGVMIINPDGKNIKKDRIDELRNTFANKPLFTQNNYYLINQAEKMNDVAFNKLLKFMEEPEDNIIGFLITENKDFMPDTIVSRCQIIKSNYSETLIKYKYNELIMQYLDALKSKTNDIVWYNESVICKELTVRSDYIKFFKELLDYIMNEIKSGNDREHNLKVVMLLKKYLYRLNYNVNTTLLLNSFALEMVEIYEK